MYYVKEHGYTLSKQMPNQSYLSVQWGEGNFPDFPNDIPVDF